VKQVSHKEVICEGTAIITFTTYFSDWTNQIHFSGEYLSKRQYINHMENFCNDNTNCTKGDEMEETAASL
jgi:hypothetical protein